MDKIRVFEAFSGVGSQRMALRNIGIKYEVVATSEIDEYAILSYNEIHTAHKEVAGVSDEYMQSYLERLNIPLNSNGKRKVLKGNKLKDFYEAVIKSNNIGDISKVNTKDIPDHDLFTYSFPCQDISVAGKGKGLDKGSGTRSGLLWECEKVIKVKKPKYLLLENVKNLVSKKHKHNFDLWLEWLETQGYTNYWKVINSKEQGVPQNRERVFVVSILGAESYEFPEDQLLTKVLEDILEEEDSIEEKYYLRDEIQDRFVYKPSKTDISILGTSAPFKTIGQRDIVYGTDGIMGSLMATDYKQPKQILRLNIGTNLSQIDDGIAFKGNKDRRGRVMKQGIGELLTKSNVLVNKDEDLRIRKLTPLEYWRLMGFSDEDFNKAQKKMSDTQLYKQAGNSIVVPVLEGIFRQMFI